MYKKDFKIILGEWLNGKEGISEPFNEDKINFLGEISKKILIDKKLNIYPDLKDFGFWCRKKNLIKLKYSLTENKTLLGRGIALHIPPSNVPMNLAFTMAFGLLAGCENFIRLPENEFPQTKIFLSIIKRIVSAKKFNAIKKSLCVIKYDKCDKKSSFMSELSDVRLIWGGDKTVEKFKEYKTKIKNVDLYFPNKISGSLIYTKKVKKLNSKELSTLAYKFYNDSFLMDQKGCSSPKIIFWLGKNKNIENKFINELSEFITKKYRFDYAKTNNKIFLLSELGLNSNQKIKTSLNKIKLTMLNINKPPKEHTYSDLSYGAFYIVYLKSLKDIIKYINSNFQTLSFFGFNKDELKEFIIKNKLKGVDRVMPIGRAFEMGLDWDGYDIIRQMCRTIC